MKGHEYCNTITSILYLLFNIQWLYIYKPYNIYPVEITYQ